MLQRVHFNMEVPFKTNKVEDLVLQPKVIRVTKFDDEGVKAFADDMAKAHELGQPIIPVVIDSYGGSVYGLLSMVSLVQQSKIPVATIVEGKAMSAGAALFTCGAKGMRYMAPGSYLMIHEVSSWSIGKIEELKADTAQVDRLNKDLFALMAKNCGHEDPNYFLKIIHEKSHADWYLGTDEALRHGIANHARLPQMTLRLSSELELE